MKVKSIHIAGDTFVAVGEDGHSVESGSVVIALARLLFAEGLCCDRAHFINQTSHGELRLDEHSNFHIVSADEATQEGSEDQRASRA